MGPVLPKSSLTHVIPSIGKLHKEEILYSIGISFVCLLVSFLTLLSACCGKTLFRADCFRSSCGPTVIVFHYPTKRIVNSYLLV